MKVFGKVDELVNELELCRNKGFSIGFVPTMGALHLGHLSLINIASAENDLVVMSIFVNPTQFNNPVDLEKYPRNLEKDIELLKETKCQIIFAPSEHEIYPDESYKKASFDFGNIATVMEGKYRPSHFDGVGVVVKRLFEIVRPNRAYFGQKDIQQFLIINHLNKKYLQDLNIELIKCPIVRENDGLAMSSRNMLLTQEQRQSAVLISQTLFKAKDNYHNYSVNELKKWVFDNINKDKNLKVEYFELANDPDLEEIKEWDDKKRTIACIAVFAGNIRLIDNIYFN